MLNWFLKPYCKTKTNLFKPSLGARFAMGYHQLHAIVIDMLPFRCCARPIEFKVYCREDEEPVREMHLCLAHETHILSIVFFDT